ncbi:MAG: hypothetical protein IT497_00070 [Ottowia sp.]|nr:hypothetical protein [Ottowia sp.]
MKLRDFREQGYGIKLQELPKTRKEAAEKGITYFWTGKPCVNGHYASRYTKGGTCTTCTRGHNNGDVGVERYSDNNYARKKAAQLGQLKYTPKHACKNGHKERYVHSNNCIQCSKETDKKQAINRKFQRIKKIYGLDKEAYLSMVVEQNSCCKICGTHKSDHFNLHVDHCHTTMKVRALLCSKCNQAIGLLNHDVELIKKTIGYLDATS